MEKVKVSLPDVEAVKDFTNIILDYKGDFDLRQGHYAVDGKSLNGVLSMDLSQPMDFVIHYDGDEQEIIKAVEKYII